MTDAFHAAGPFAVTPAPAETPEIRRVAFDAPYAWLAAGWRDLRDAPGISLAYGAVFAAFAYVAALQLTRLDALPLLLPVAFGFLLVGPILAAGLYEVSRLRERGEPVTFRGIAHRGMGRQGSARGFRNAAVRPVLLLDECGVSSVHAVLRAGQLPAA